VSTLTLNSANTVHILTFFLIQDRGKERVSRRFFVGPGDWTSLTSYLGFACMLPASRKFGRLTQKRPSRKSERPDKSMAEFGPDCPRKGPNFQTVTRM
jgi:hypothetical protein